MKRLVNQGIVCLLLLIFTIVSASAQTLRRVTVELKNGRFLQGEMAVTLREDYLSLRQANQAVTHIPYRKIRTLTFGSSLLSEKTPPRFLVQKRRFFHLGEINVLAGNGDYSPNTAVGFHTVNGYHFNPHLGLGLGIGIDHYGPVSTLPIYASARGALLKSKISPYYFVRAGASPAWGRSDDASVSNLETRGGWMVHTGLGYQINFNRSALLFHAGFKAQQTSATYQENWWWDGNNPTVEETRIIRRLSFGIGFML